MKVHEEPLKSMEPFHCNKRFFQNGKVLYIVQVFFTLRKKIVILRKVLWGTQNDSSVASLWNPRLEPLFLRVCKEHFNNLKNLLWNGKIPCTLTVLYGTTDAKKEHLFLIVCFPKGLKSYLCSDFIAFRPLFQFKNVWRMTFECFSEAVLSFTEGGWQL